jgi:hypothetical protein
VTENSDEGRNEGRLKTATKNREGRNGRNCDRREGEEGRRSLATVSATHATTSQLKNIPFEIDTSSKHIGQCSLGLKSGSDLSCWLDSCWLVSCNDDVVSAPPFSVTWTQSLSEFESSSESITIISFEFESSSESITIIPSE